MLCASYTGTILKGIDWFPASNARLHYSMMYAGCNEGSDDDDYDEGGHGSDYTMMMAMILVATVMRK